MLSSLKQIITTKINSRTLVPLKILKMDNSCSESDVSLSPSHIFEKLDMLRQLQMLQRGKLLRQHLDYQNTPEVSSSITEIVSHFSNSTTYNTFKSLLQSSRDNSNDETPRNKVDEETCRNSDQHQVINVQDVMEGVSALNLSHKSECITTPISSQTSNRSKLSDFNEKVRQSDSKRTLFIREEKSLGEMPIQSPKKNFDELIMEELKHDKAKQISEKKETSKPKKQFLKRGEGMARFGIKKNDLVIQNTKSLPWQKKTGSTKMLNISSKGFKPKTSSKSDKVKIQISLPNIAKESQSLPLVNQDKSNNKIQINLELPNNEIKSVSGYSPSNHSSSNLHSDNISRMNLNVNSTKEVYPNVTNNKKTWAAVLTTEQNDFLRQLKQSDYYKNFSSPTKSVESDISCSESISNVLQCKETAEQNLFDLIENKVSHESFNVNNSFFGRFISKSTFECSGESTPLVMQKCLAKNPGLMHLSSKLNKNIIKDNNSCSADETCTSECTDCSDCCSESTCCSCQTVTKVHSDSKIMAQNNKTRNVKMSLPVTENRDRGSKIECQDSNDRSEIDKVNANMVEMNAKLIATSDILKERLCELEDEIETFRKENSNITKMREELDLERQKFYEEKSTCEQKFNEEKILSEYHLAEEREKVMKQKQMYERYIRDMRGRLNKREKGEVVSLKKEILDLKDEIRLKDAKSTSTIARLRNQLKLIEKDKKTLEEEVEKLKKENQKIHHRNEVTRRLTNIKYLEQINKKLSTMASRETKSEVDLDPDVKYKAYEIEKQSKLKTKGIRTRAKSVPNLNVTSKYAKYFSQKDFINEKEKNTLVKTHIYTSDNHIENDYIEKSSNADNFSENEDNYLEKIYNERFKSNSPSSRRSSGSNLSDSPPYHNVRDGTCGFFLQKSNSMSSNKRSSPIITTPNSFNASISKSTIINETLHHTFNQQPTVRDTKISSQNRSRSPVSIMSNNSTNGQKPMTVIHNEAVYSNHRLMPSPEPTSSISITKSNLNPVEIMNSNGTRELRFPNGNVKIISANGKYSKFKYYNGDIKENFYDEGRVKYFYAKSKTYHTTHPDGLEILEFPDGQMEKRYKDGSSEIRLPNGMVRYFDPKNDAVREEWRYPDGTALTVSANDEQHITFPNGQIEVHAKDHKRREFPDGTVKLVYRDGTSETRYASGRVRIKDKHGNLVMDSGSTTNHSIV